MFSISVYFVFNVYGAVERLSEVLLAVISSDMEEQEPSKWVWIRERTDGGAGGQKNLIDTPAPKPNKTQGTKKDRKA